MLEMWLPESTSRSFRDTLHKNQPYTFTYTVYPCLHISELYCDVFHIIDSHTYTHIHECLQLCHVPDDWSKELKTCSLELVPIQPIKKENHRLGHDLENIKYDASMCITHCCDNTPHA